MLHKIPMYRFLLLLLTVGLASSRILEETRETKVIFEETTMSDQSIRETTTPASLLRLVTHSDQESTSSKAVLVKARNDSHVFTPSRHLGRIEQPVVRTSLFNNVQPMRFENKVHLDTQRFQNILQDASQGVSGLLDEATRSSRIRFQDDGVVQQTSNVQHSIHQSIDDQQTVTEGSKSPFEEGHVYVDQTYFQNAEKPGMQESFGKTMTGIYYDPSKSPHTVNYYVDQNQNAYQPTSQEAAVEMMKRPESNGVMVLQKHESTYTRKRKFPYPFYQPGDEYHDMQFMEDPHAAAAFPRIRRPFPWKKIVHLLGTFLPLGLLLASLKPNVIRIGNTTTQPSIVLSKLRLADLPIEHKQARMLNDRPIVCEDRSICELILAGGEPQSNILQNILWNLASRAPDDVAKRNGLREVFNAVRKKDCTAISC